MDRKFPTTEIKILDFVELTMCADGKMLREDLFFRVCDVIPETMVQNLIQYIPPDNSLSNSRVYREVYEDDQIESEQQKKEQTTTLGFQIWSLIEDYLPISYEDKSIIGRSHRIRFIRELAQNSIAFPKHFDEIESPYPLERFSNYEITAQLTILIYLNNGLVGGKAFFYLNDHDYREVIPEPGRVVIFDRRILHCAEPLQPSSQDKFFLKCCALYGREKSDSSVSSSSLSSPVSQLPHLLKSFEEATNPQMKRSHAVKICQHLSSSTDASFTILKFLPKLFFVICQLLQSPTRDDRLLAYSTLELFPRKEFVESELALLLGETLLRDSMDLDQLIASKGVKGIFFYSQVSGNLWGGYLHKWLTSPSIIIRESCLTGLIEVMWRYHYGWNQQDDVITTTKVHHPEQLDENFWSPISSILPLIDSLACHQVESFELETTNRELEILRGKCHELYELYPLLLD